MYKHFTFINLFKDLASYGWEILTVYSGSWSCLNFRTQSAWDLCLIVDEDQSNEFPDPIELVFIFELFEVVVVIQLAFVFKLFQGIIVFELVFDFEPMLPMVVIELSFVFELFEGMVFTELAFVFELFVGVVLFELFDRPSTWSSLNSLSSSNSLKAWPIQLTLWLAGFLRHATFQAFYMHFGTIYICFRCNMHDMFC